MLGGLFEASAAGTLVVNASFWMGTIWMVTLGCALWKAAAACCQTVLSCPVVALVHQVRVTCPFPELVAFPLLTPQAARGRAAAAATAPTAGFRRLRILLIS